MTYREIADDMQGRIRCGEFPPGLRLGPHAEMARRYGVSEATWQRALMLLRDRGVVVGVPGRGVYVAGAADGRGGS